jgi:cytochrome b involved in lipid metabolism
LIRYNLQPRILLRQRWLMFGKNDDAMSIIGISIIIASLSFLFYKHLPSWRFLSWRRNPRLPVADRQKVAEGEMGLFEEDGEKGRETREEEEQKEVKAKIDRKAMPPPPPSFKMYSATGVQPPVYLDRRQAVPDVVSLPVSRSIPDNSSSSNPLVPFPAQISIQRASSGRDPSQMKRIPVLRSPLSSQTSLTPLHMCSPLPNRGPLASSSLASPPTHSAVPTKPSKKVLLAPGHSPLDWAYLSSLPNVNLRGLPPSTSYLKVPPSLLRKYTGRKGKDAWTVLGGKVYNITPYLPYHPGGELELMKAAGRDGTKLFGEVHPWINWEGMLESCLVGVAVAEDETQAQSQLENMD